MITEFLWIFSYNLHGVLSNSTDTLWHSMELHQYFREPHGIPWNSTIFHGIPWTSKETPWNFMAFHGTPSILHRTPWNSMAFHGTPWILHGYSMQAPWNSMDFHRRVFQKTSSILLSTLDFPWTKNEPNRSFDCGHEFSIFVWFLLTFTLKSSWRNLAFFLIIFLDKRRP